MNKIGKTNVVFVLIRKRIVPRTNITLRDAYNGGTYVGQYDIVYDYASIYNVFDDQSTPPVPVIESPGS